MSSESIVTHYNLSEIHRLDDDITEEIIKNIHFVLHENDIDFTGNLSNSAKPDIIDEIRYILVDSPYATVVDKGMPPGKNVNFDALRNWVEKKLGITDKTELDTVTIKIQKKILGKGIKPTFFVKKAIKMLIGKRGVPRISNRRSSGKIGRAQRALNKIAKIMRKVNRFTKKIGKNIDKVNKGIKKTGR